MSDKQDEIRARYEAAMGCKNSDNLTETGKKIFAALADIPYLLGELKRVTGAVETSTEKAISDKASEKQYREALWREFDTGLHLSRYSDANAETSDDMKAVRARYEAAMRHVQGECAFVKESLADIPRLLQENERLKEAFDASLDSTEKAEREAFDLRAQLANAEAFRTAALAPMDCGHAYGYCYHDECDDVMDEVRVCLVCERKRLCGQLAERDAEVERLREALKLFTEGAHHTRIFLTSREKMHPDGVKLWDEAVRRAGEAMEEKSDENSC